MIPTSLRWRAYLYAAATACLMLTTACHGSRKAQVPRLHTVYGVFDPAFEHLSDIATPVAVRADSRRLKIVQFIGRIQPDWRRILVNRGMAVRGYMPEDAFVVEATSEDAAWLATLPMVRAVVDEPRLWRIDPRLVEAPEDGTPGFTVRRSAATADVAVELVHAGVRDQVTTMIEAMHGRVLDDAISHPGGRVLHVRSAEGLVDALAADTDVSSVEPFEPVHTTDAARDGVDRIDALRQDEVWDHGLRGQDQVVATCDVGVFTNACYFGGDKILAYQNVTDSTEHNHDHGTHAAGGIAGDREDNGVYDTFDGAAPAARLFVQDAGTGRSGEISVPPDLGTLFTPAYDAGARIQANTWSGDTDVYGARERSLDAFAAAHRDFLVVTASGNNGADPATVSSPATAKNVIAVGAVSGSTPEDVATFSAHGPTGDNRIKPTLVAPGEGIVAASGRGVCAATRLSGTSMAASAVAGAAALVRQYYEEGFYPTGAPNIACTMEPSAALIKATLLAGTDDLAGEGTGGAFPAAGQGFGRMHLDNALIFGDAARHLYVHDDQEGLEQAETFNIPVEVKGGSLHVALSWTDEPAVAGAASALVNDLDLELVAPDGTRYFGNQLSAGESAPSRDGDHANVEEILYVAHAKPGMYQLTVRAYNAPMAPQPYALVIVGTLGEQTGRHAVHSDAPAVH